MAVDGRFCIAVYTIKPIAPGEELCFDYNSVYAIPTSSNTVYDIPVAPCLSVPDAPA
jgi:SET domain-containing protein